MPTTLRNIRYVATAFAVTAALSCCVLHAPAQAAGLKTSDITSISIQAEPGYPLGDFGDNASGYAETIGHGEGTFVRTDGSIVRDKDVQSLVDAINDPIEWSSSPNESGLDRAALLNYLDSVERQTLGAATSLPEVRAAFESTYLNSDQMNAWLLNGHTFATPPPVGAKDANGNPVLRRVIMLPSGQWPAPSIRVIITTRSGDIEIESNSRHDFMLPLGIFDRRGMQDAVLPRWIARNIEDERGMRLSSDPRLSRALAALMPYQDPVSDDLTGAYAFLEWGRAVASTEPVIGAIERTAISEKAAQRIAKDAGLTIESCWVSQPSLSQVKYSMCPSPRLSDIALKMMLQPVNAAFASLRRATWLIAALATRPNARITMAPEDQAKVHDYAAGLSGNGLLSEILQADEARVTALSISEGQNSRSDWYLLGDGSMVLVDESGVSPPFTPHEYTYESHIAPDGKPIPPGSLIHPI